MTWWDITHLCNCDATRKCKIIWNFYREWSKFWECSRRDVLPILVDSQFTKGFCFLYEWCTWSTARQCIDNCRAPYSRALVIFEFKIWVERWNLWLCSTVNNFSGNKKVAQTHQGLWIWFSGTQEPQASSMIVHSIIPMLRRPRWMTYHLYQIRRSIAD